MSCDCNCEQEKKVYCKYCKRYDFFWGSCHIKQKDVMDFLMNTPVSDIHKICIEHLCHQGMLDSVSVVGLSFDKNIISFKPFQLNDDNNCPLYREVNLISYFFIRIFKR